MKDTTATRTDTALGELRSPRSELFWADLPPRDHSVQIYGTESNFMDALEGYASSGLRRGEGVIIISTAAHMHELEKRLRAGWVDIDRARWEDRYIAVLAQETLNRFMIDGEPDEELFKRVASDLLARARGHNSRKVRAFGEMVAILWGQGNAAGAIKVEQLWSKLQATEEFPLFCAYPHAGFVEQGSEAIDLVCCNHSRVIPGYR